jgi:hypothetical protein
MLTPMYINIEVETDIRSVRKSIFAILLSSKSILLCRSVNDFEMRGD